MSDTIGLRTTHTLEQLCLKIILCYPYLSFLMYFMVFQTLKKMCSSFYFICLFLFSFLNTWNLIYKEAVHKMANAAENMFIYQERKWQCPSQVKQLP